jgi:hypothetical protein
VDGRGVTERESVIVPGVNLSACGQDFPHTADMQRDFGEQKVDKKPGLRPGSVSDTKLPYSLSPRFSSIGSICGSCRATGDKVLLNQCCCRGTKSPRGSADRFRGLTAVLNEPLVAVVRQHLGPQVGVIPAACAAKICEKYTTYKDNL